MILYNFTTSHKFHIKFNHDLKEIGYQRFLVKEIFIRHDATFYFSYKI